MHLAGSLPDRSHMELLNPKDATKQEMAPLLGSSIDPPRAGWVTARRDQDGRQLPQTIAHRGYKAKYPENTLAAFDGAVRVGAHAVETDIHLSKDGVVVLSHDANLKRCFGLKDKIIDCNWDYLSTLRTTKEPHSPMPRLLDLLDYLSLPGHEYIWALLDIKIDNSAEDVVRLIAQTLNSHSQSLSQSRPWSSRIVLGIWAAKYLPLCTTYLPSYSIAHIGFSISYARQFLSVPHVSFNMLQPILLGPIGIKFIRDVRQDPDRSLFVWTVNDEEMMRWSIRKEVDAVITDEPERFLRVCREWETGDGEEQRQQRIRVGVRMWLYVLGLYVLVAIFGILFKIKFPEKVRERVKRREGEAETSSETVAGKRKDYG